MPEPTKIPRPFADSGDKNSIPDSSGGLGFASWQEGFPAITGTPFAQGGVAPKRADFNGIFNALSAATVWNQQGGVYAYDATTDYEVGNVVEYSGNLYKCITANGPSSAVKGPTDTTVWDAIATASRYLPLSGGTLTGSLDINGNPVAVVDSVDSTANGYIRFTNGLQFIWARADIPSGSSQTGVAITFEKAFSTVPCIFTTVSFNAAYGYGYAVQPISRTSTGCTFIIGSSSGGTTQSFTNGAFCYLAIGPWA